jgi:RNA polymerase sigma factor (sigma-70 family)
LVLNVAGRLLAQTADIEDVFQAAFLTLARKASAIRRGTAVGSWLYKVAYRLALRVRRTTSCNASAGLEVVAAPERPQEECSALLAEEISRLPQRYRAAVVLCYLQGNTTEQAARILGCPRGTILSRLASARQRLRRRLLRRGVAPVVAATVVMFSETASATPSAVLVASVVGAALPFAAGRAALPTVSPHAALLAQGALQTMLWNKIKITVAMLCVMILAGGGVGWLTRGQAEDQSSPPRADKPGKQATKSAPEREREERLDPVKQIDFVRKELASLSEREADLEELLTRLVIEAKLQLMDYEEELRLSELQWNLERQDMEARLKHTANQILSLEADIRDLERKLAKDTPTPQQVSLTKQLKETNEELHKQQTELLERTTKHNQRIRPLREKMIRAEEQLRRHRSSRTEKHEEYLARRQALEARIERLEDASMHLPPTDQLRDVQRKLDALRREVNELRTTLERPKER